jgi:hypothetical protein
VSWLRNLVDPPKKKGGVPRPADPTPVARDATGARAPALPRAERNPFLDQPIPELKRNDPGTRISADSPVGRRLMVENEDDAMMERVRAQQAAINQRPIEAVGSMLPVVGNAMGVKYAADEGVRAARSGNIPGMGLALAMGAMNVLPGGGGARGKGPLSSGRWAVLTAENPGGTAMSAEQNAARLAQMATEMKRRGLKFKLTEGQYADPTTGEMLTERGFFVYDVPEREAKLLSQRFGQNGVLTQRGYHDMADGKFYAREAIQTGSTVGAPFTEIKGGPRFSMKTADTATPPVVSALPVPKGANAEAQRIAEMAGADPAAARKTTPPTPATGRQLATVFERLPSEDPAARESYEALARETADQLKSIEDAGYKIEYTDADPYKSSAEMVEDITKNRRLKVFKSGADFKHPFLSAEQNDQFRAVHDFIAHAGGGAQFGPYGENRAFMTHMPTYSPKAQLALGTETRGQNSWVNYRAGGRLDNPETMAPADRPFAEQKGALWPRAALGDLGDLPPLIELPREPFIGRPRSPEIGGDGARRSYAARGGDVAEVLFSQPNASTLNVDWMGSTGDVGSLGPRAVRQLARGIPEEFPSVTSVDNNRISGARYNTATNSLDVDPDEGFKFGIKPLTPRIVLPGGDPTRVAPKAEGMRNTPEEIGLRLRRVEEIMRQPVEPYVPRTAGLVDRSIITPDAPGYTRGDPLHERTLPGDRAAMGQFEGIDSAVNRQLIELQMRRGETLGGSWFYPSYGAFEDRIGQAGGDTLGWLNATSGSSIKTPVFNELSNASIIMWGVKQGMLDPAALATMPQEQLNALALQLRQQATQQFGIPTGLPLMGTHLQSFGRLSMGATPESFKVPTYRAQKGSVHNPNMGDVPGIVLDTHEAKGQTLASPFHDYHRNNGGFIGADYGVQEDFARQMARSLAMRDRTAQANRWFGGARITGVDTPLADYAQNFEGMAMWNAVERNLDPQRLVDEVARGENILFPYMQKDAGFMRALPQRR